MAHHAGPRTWTLTVTVPDPARITRSVRRWLRRREQQAERYWSLVAFALLVLSAGGYIVHELAAL